MPDEPLELSPKMEDLYKSHVLDKVKVPGTRLALGYEIGEIREIVEWGQADFTKGYKDELTAKQVVDLYCYSNMRMHFFEALTLFRRNLNALKSLFCDNDGGLMVDIGCGPGTAGLALAECLKN